jgi:hypothetical protein
VPHRPQAPDLGAIKDRQQKTWTAGDYARIGNTLVIMGELLCEAVDVRAGDKVLDVAEAAAATPPSPPPAASATRSVWITSRS